MVGEVTEHAFVDSHGARLVAAVHEPPDGAWAAVIFLHGWAGYRMGAHRMLYQAAAAAARAGLVAIRFDFRGRGDSEGDTMAACLATMIEDTVAICRWVHSRWPELPVFLVGDCSGCEVAIGAAPLVPQVRGLVLWSAPIIGDQRQEAEAAKRRAVIADYVRKAFSIESWRKLVCGAIRWDQVWKAIRRGGRGEREESTDADRQIPWTQRFLQFSGPVLFIYGGADPTAPAAIEVYRRLSGQAGREFELHVVEGANHAFYGLEWKREVIERTIGWISAQVRRG